MHRHMNPHIHTCDSFSIPATLLAFFFLIIFIISQWQWVRSLNMADLSSLLRVSQGYSQGHQSSYVPFTNSDPPLSTRGCWYNSVPRPPVTEASVPRGCVKFQHVVLPLRDSWQLQSSEEGFLTLREGHVSPLRIPRDSFRSNQGTCPFGGLIISCCEASGVHSDRRHFHFCNWKTWTNRINTISLYIKELKS